MVLTSKEWIVLLMGAIVGALTCLLLQNILYPICLGIIRQAKERRLFLAINESWKAFHDLFPSLQLFQAGWPPSGTFLPPHVLIRLADQFTLPDQIRTEIRDRHTPEWDAKGFTDGEQVGIKSIRIRRVSDDPEGERCGRSHIIEISAHSYRYYDFLSTHRLVASGSHEERSLLRTYVGEPNPEQPVDGFPNPLSVGLSLFCEEGQVLVLAVRTKVEAVGGSWHGGKVFNSVGENLTLSDFSASVSGELESSPTKVAQRGLYQEVGFLEHDIDRCSLALHSLAWASDILDHKFFGYAITPLAQSEVRAKWENASDRENRLVYFEKVGTHQECLNLWGRIIAARDQWSPEAIFCTARSLLILGRLLPGDLLASHSRRGKVAG